MKILTISSYCSETMFFLPAMTRGSAWNSLNKWYRVTYKTSCTRCAGNQLPLTGFSVVSVKKILIWISNSPHPVSCTSNGGDVNTKEIKPMIFQHKNLLCTSNRTRVALVQPELNFFDVWWHVLHQHIWLMVCTKWKSVTSFLNGRR